MKLFYKYRLLIGEFLVKAENMIYPVINKRNVKMGYFNLCEIETD
jgi:hypothetical protein